MKMSLLKILHRELEEETGVKDVPIKLVDVFSQSGRDPRGWVVSVAFVAVVDAERVTVQAGDDAAEALWYDIELSEDGVVLHRDDRIIGMNELAFDHAEILKKALYAIVH